MRASLCQNSRPSLPMGLTSAPSPPAWREGTRTPKRRQPVRRVISSLAVFAALVTLVAWAQPLSASALRPAHGSHLLRPSRDQQTDKAIPTLELGKPVERELSGGQSHSYRVLLAAGQYLHVVVDQRGIDVVVGLYGPDAKKLTEVDSPNGTQGPERVSWITETKGVYRLEVRSLQKEALMGKYEARIEAVRPAMPQDRFRVRAEKRYIDGWVLLAQATTAEDRRKALGMLSEALSDWTLAGDKPHEVLLLLGLGHNLIGEREKALDYYKQALTIMRQVGDRLGEATTLNNIGSVYDDLGDKQKALEHYNLALPISREFRDRIVEAATLNNIGLVYSSLGEKERALDYYSQALPIQQQVGDRTGEAKTLNNIGAVYISLGEKQKALDYFNQTLPILRQVADRIGEATTLNNIGLVYSSLGEWRKAQDYYSRGLGIQQQIGDRTGEAKTLNNIGAMYSLLGEWQKALDYYNEALSIRLQVRDRSGYATTLDNIGVVHSALGEWQKALDYYSRALEIRGQVGDESGKATTLNNIGKVYDDLGEKQKALDYYNSSLPIRRRVRDRSGEAATLNNIGSLYGSLGEKRKALEYYNQALAIMQEVRDRSREAATLNNIGGVYDDLGEKQQALYYYNKALPIRRQVGDRSGEATTLSNIGSVYVSLGGRQQALDYYNQALPIMRQVGDRFAEAATLNNIGSVYILLGDSQKALDYFNQALPIRRRAGDRGGEAVTLMNLSHVFRDRDQLDKASTFAEQSLEISEGIRKAVAGHDSRSSYTASIEDDYEYYVDLLMMMHKQRPTAGFSTAALQRSELARARTLLDLLIDSRADIRNGVAPDLLARERSLQQQLAAKEQRRIELASKAGSEAELAGLEALDKELRQAYSEYEDVQAEIRTRSPKYASLTQPRPLNAKQIQESVLDADTLLLEYSLGTERSYLWVVSTKAITSYELPKRREIDDLAEDFIRAASRGGQNPRGGPRVNDEADYRGYAVRLSRMLLGKAAPLLGNKRLLIVAAGALEYVPFAALPDPALLENESIGDSTVPLIGAHEIVTAPSASVVGELRSELKDRAPATKAMAILADPVFRADDPRVTRPGKHAVATAKTEAPGANLQRLLLERVASLWLLRGNVFTRLAGTREEADQITSLLARDQYTKYLDFDASKPTASGPSLAGVRYIHFATHGVLDAEHPDLTGLVLSTVDAQGNPVDWFLPARDVYNLKLRAEMVALSACETALGKQIRGEGLVGLTRGFMYAGAPRVIASLWEVDDTATAELMTRLYTGILKEGKRPAQALREAQLAMWKQKKYQAPYYWAAFELQGEWR
jgi:tetratricopeptide (TPR) repeat protein